MVHLLRRRLLWPVLCRLGRHPWRYDVGRFERLEPDYGPPIPFRYCPSCRQVYLVTREEWVASQATGRARS